MSIPSPEQIEPEELITPAQEAAAEQGVSQEPDAAQYKDRWQRAVADLENQRKRADQDRIQQRLSAAEGIISELLPVVDNFYRATEHVPAQQKDSSWLTGIMYIQKQLVDVLEAQGVSEIPAKDGDQFDPHTQEAIQHEVSETEKDNSVMVVSKGYTLNGKLMRPVRVTVYTNETK